MKRIFVLSILICFLSQSCKNDDDSLNNTCNVSNPIEDFDWLKEIVEDFQQSSQVDEAYIYQSTYERKTVFIIGSCCAYCNTFISVAYCNGESAFNIIDNEGEKEAYDKFLISYQGDLIWSSSNFVCND